MKLSLDPLVIAPRNITAESLALAAWYDSQPLVRRLWGIKDAARLRVIIAVEPTNDGDDIYPVWLANSETWADELHWYTGSSVHLELIDESPFDGIEFDAESVVVADLFWRDATLIRPHTMV
jgi:hypothetical protein